MMEDHQPSLDDVIAAFEQGRRPMAADLPALSALSGSETNEVAASWNRLSDPDRAAFLQQLREVSEDNAEFDFSSVFRLGLADADETIRLAAVDGLWESEDRWLLQSLLNTLAGEQSLAVRGAIVSSLGRFVVAAEIDDRRSGDGDTLRQVLLGLLSGQSENILIRRLALEAMGADSSSVVQERIRREFEGSVRDLRLGALHAMGRSCDRSWLTLLVEELNTEDAEFRYEAIAAIGRIGEPSGVVHLVKALDDEDQTVQLAAISSLGEIGGDMAVNHLAALARSSDPSIQEAADDALIEARFNSDPLGLRLS